MIEFQIVLNVYLQDGRNVKHSIKSLDRESAVTKFKYLQSLVSDKKRIGELKSWSHENLSQPGVVTALDGLYGVVAIKIM
jgi:hypothetical protein